MSSDDCGVKGVVAGGYLLVSLDKVAMAYVMYHAVEYAVMGWRRSLKATRAVSQR